MTKLSSSQKIMCEKLLSLFKNNDDIKTVEKIHKELIGDINFSINSTFYSFICPLLERGYLDIVNKMPQSSPSLRKMEIVRCY